MDTHVLIDILLFLSFFLGLVAVVQKIAAKYQFPYTIALLFVGFLSQFLVRMLHIPLHLEMHPDIIYFILLPILLFEAAQHINFHQFRIQFKTISFLSTVGLLISVFVVGTLLSVLVGLPFKVALLFGAIISATDPIAVLALFKTLGAPRRLSLLADGESMFNDATGVIAFRLIAGFVVVGNDFETEAIIHGAGDFLYIFLGSMLFGILFGYLSSKLIELVKKDRLIVTVFTAAAALGSFVAAEHFFHFSGVISTVMAGITIGNLGKTKISYRVNHFVEEFWESLGFVALSLVFFFASFNLDLGIFAREPLNLIYAIIAVLIARLVSVYVSVFFTNRLGFFKDEPNMPLSWQHILNWGGLRGVIPLVLAYSLPDTFIYKEQLLAFTFATLLFTLIINGLTIKTLLIKLKLHVAKKEEQIIHDEERIFALEEARNKLESLPDGEFQSEAIVDIAKQVKAKELGIRDHLLKITSSEELSASLKLQSLSIERETVEKLYHSGHINESVYYEFDTELDLQQDALEYPEVFSTRVVSGEGKIESHGSYRHRLQRLRRLIARFPLLKSLIEESEYQLIENRYSLLRARVFSSKKVLEYITHVGRIFTNSTGKRALSQLKGIELKLIAQNEVQLKALEKKYPAIISRYQKRILTSMLEPQH